METDWGKFVMETEKNTHEGEKSTVRTLRPVATVFLSLVIMAVAAMLIFGIYSSEPKAERETATRETAMLVDVLPVERRTYIPRITGLGAVTPAQDIELRHNWQPPKRQSFRRKPPLIKLNWTSAARRSLHRLTHKSSPVTPISARK